MNLKRTCPECKAEIEVPEPWMTQAFVGCMFAGFEIRVMCNCGAMLGVEGGPAAVEPERPLT